MLVTVATYPRALEAQLAQARLAAEGIEAIVADEQMSSILPLHAAALGGVRLQVPEEDEVAALEVLELAAEDVGDDDDEVGALSCERCGSPYVELGRTMQEHVFGVLSLGVYLLVSAKRWHCQRCSHAWDGPPPSPAATGKLAASSHTPYRDAGRRAAEREPRVCFRFPQSRAGVGLFFGLVVGLLASRLVSDLGAVALALALAIPVVGWFAGRLVITYACSACRRTLARGAERCPGCRGEVQGLIADSDDHFRAIAEIGDRRRKKRKKKKHADPAVS